MFKEYSLEESFVFTIYDFYASKKANKRPIIWITEQITVLKIFIGTDEVKKTKIDIDGGSSTNFRQGTQFDL